MNDPILVTGVTGHAGAALVDRILDRTMSDVVILRRLPRSGPERNAHLLGNPRVHTLYHDFRSPVPRYGLEDVKYIIHNGAECHAIRSITDPELFWKTNTLGTFNMLELARMIQPRRFLYTSSAEVVPFRIGGALESDPMLPPNPYAASKAAGELLVHSYDKSFSVPAVTTRTINLFGEKQQNTKFVPVIVNKILRDEVVDVHTDDKCVPGLRQWLHVEPYADALLDVLLYGRIGETYHIAGETKDNLEIVRAVANAMGTTYRAVAAKHQYPNSVPIHHELNTDKLWREVRWLPRRSFDDYLKQTVNWYLANQEWLR